MIDRLMRRLVAVVGVVLMTSCRPEGEPINPALIRVIDGDTIEFSGETLRLLGYDTPEAWEPECMGERHKARMAKRHLEDLLGSGEVVRVAQTGERDRYNRALAHLFIGGRSVAELMLEDGLGRAYDGGHRPSWC